MLRPTALILTARYGSGHVQVAKVIAQELEDKGFEPIISDLFGESYPVMSQITQSLFIKSFSHGSSLYKWFYYGTNKLNSKRIPQFSRYLGRKRLMELITKHRPQFVITTFPLHSAPFLIKKYSYSIPIYTVLTDYVAHTSWINPLIDHYFVASDSVKVGLVKNGVDEKKITVSGIPIWSKFYQRVDKHRVFQKYKVSPNRKVVTVMAGAQGVLKNVKEMCELFLQKSTHQLIVVCGNNKALYEKLLPLAQRYPNSIRLLGYVNEVHEIFSISDCLITKPGGITVTEAAAIQVPLILFRPIPGQEGENAKHFNNHGAAVVAHSIMDAYKHAQRITQNKELAISMKTGLHFIHKAHSAKVIIDEAISQIEQQSVL